MGICIYSDLDETGEPQGYAIIPSIQNDTKWLWTKFRKINVSNDVLRVIGIIERLFLNDHEIKSVSRYDDFPY
jgi:hypothetical protein